MMTADDPGQTDIEDYVNSVRSLVDRAHKTTCAKEAQLLWRKNIPAVQDALRYRHFHPGIPGFLPHMNPDRIWKAVQAAQKRCRVGLLTREDVIAFCEEWIWLRSWLLEYTDSTFFTVYLWSRTLKRPAEGRDATILQLTSDDVQDGAAVAVYRGGAPKGPRDKDAPWIQITVKAPKTRGRKKVVPPHEGYVKVKQSYWMAGWI